MCQCGCGETTAQRAFELPSGLVLAIHIYKGCADCFAGPSIDFYIYPSRNGERICFECGMKDEKTTKRKFAGYVFGEYEA